MDYTLIIMVVLLTLLSVWVVATTPSTPQSTLPGITPDGAVMLDDDLRTRLEGEAYSYLQRAVGSTTSQIKNSTRIYTYVGPVSIREMSIPHNGSYVKDGIYTIVGTGNFYSRSFYLSMDSIIAQTDNVSVDANLVLKLKDVGGQLIFHDLEMEGIGIEVRKSPGSEVPPRLEQLLRSRFVLQSVTGLFADAFKGACNKDPATGIHLVGKMVLGSDEDQSSGLEAKLS